MKIIKILQNLVQIKPNEDFKDWGIKGADGEALVIPVGAVHRDGPDESEAKKDNREAQAKWDSAQHVSVAGIVLKTPERLIYNGGIINETMKKVGLSLSIASEISELRAKSVQFDVPMDLLAGDAVFFKYIEHFNCYKEGRIVTDEFEDTLLMGYDSLIMAIRDGQPIMLNGNILIEPIKLKSSESGLSMRDERGRLRPVQKKKKAKSSVGVVRYIGSPCNGYLNYAQDEDMKNIQVGDVVIYDPRLGISLEHEYHRTFHVARLVRMQRKDILIVIGNEQNVLDLDKIKL